MFAMYAAVLFVATHWPQLRIAGPEIRSDLIIHFGAFGAWTFFLAKTRWPGNLLRTGLIGIVYAAIDEGLQAIPALGRTCAWDDFAANCGGVVLGVLAVWVANRKTVK